MNLQIRHIEGLLADDDSKWFFWALAADMQLVAEGEIPCGRRFGDFVVAARAIFGPHITVDHQ